MFQTISNRINFEIQAPLHKAFDTATDDKFERLSFPKALGFRAICMGTLTVSTILDLTFKIASIVEVIFVGSGNIVAAPLKGKSGFSKGINQLCDVPKDVLKFITIPFKAVGEIFWIVFAPKLYTIEMNFYYNAGLPHLKAGTGDTSTCEKDLDRSEGHAYCRRLELERGYQMLSSEICSRYGIDYEMLPPETLPDAALPSPP